MLLNAEKFLNDTILWHYVMALSSWTGSNMHLNYFDHDRFTPFFVQIPLSTGNRHIYLKSLRDLQDCFPHVIDVSTELYFKYALSLSPLCSIYFVWKFCHPVEQMPPAHSCTRTSVFLILSEGKNYYELCFYCAYTYQCASTITCMSTEFEYTLSIIIPQKTTYCIECELLPAPNYPALIQKNYQMKMF